MPDPDELVQSALKRTIESNLVRERVVNDAVQGMSDVAYFSNGVIFSKSGNGTPFSNGIFFSKSGAAVTRDSIGDPEMLQDLIGFDEATFNAFTDRLLRLRQAKGQGPSAAH